jgi:hypothetical protein
VVGGGGGGGGGGGRGGGRGGETMDVLTCNKLAIDTRGRRRTNGAEIADVLNESIDIISRAPEKSFSVRVA